MKSEYDKCRFCLYRIDETCNRYSCAGFKPDSDRIIRKAKEESLSVSDVIALIKFEMKYENVH